MPGWENSSSSVVDAQTRKIHEVLAAQSLPILSVRGQVEEAAARGGRFVLSATPGSGKTTLAPLMLAGVRPGRVLVAAPRRVAVRSAARFVAALFGEPVGRTVGMSMRGDRRVSDRTRVEYTTTGALLRRVINEPDLPGVSAVLIDEVHERHADADLALAMVLDVADLREDLLVGVMSATAQNELFEHLLEPARRIEARGQIFPLEEYWRPHRSPLDAGGLTRGFLSHVADVARAAFDRHGSTLVFVPGVREVEAVRGQLQNLGVPALPLHGSLTSEQQDAALADGKRVVVATDIAETSLTVPGVNCVVDSGFTRAPRFDLARDAQALVTVRESRSSARQRAGRAHRTGPGVVYRCFSEVDFARLERFVRPEVESVDLTEPVLLAHAWSAPAQLRLPTAMPAPAMERAEANLRGIGALDESNACTNSGRTLVGIPVDPRMAHALCTVATWVNDAAAKAEVNGKRGATSLVRVAAQAVALLNTDARLPGSDLEAALASADKREVARLLKVARRDYPLTPRERKCLAHAPGLTKVQVPGLVTALAFPGRVGKRRGEDRAGRARFTAVSGTGFVVDPNSPLHGESWIAVGAVQTIRGVTHVRAGAPLDPEFLPVTNPSDFCEVQTAEVILDRVVGQRVRRVGAIEISRERTRAEYAPALEALRELVRERGLAVFKPSRQTQRLLDAMTFLAGADEAAKHSAGEAADASAEPGEEAKSANAHPSAKRWPAPTAEFFVNHLELLIAGTRALEGERLSSIAVTTGIRNVLGWEKAAQLDQQVPQRVQLPSGRFAPVEFDPERGPTIRAKLQECFGWRDVPRVLGRPLTIELLDPAGRPLAITGDLEYFFNEVYSQVRSQMRGRYPKHPWPEDPWAAVATNRTKRRM
ncbi:ATP-dependent helicase C-terminal domain-containing protein [Gleimia hominis]|uniref:ATP-dependent helicase C-terminal domain-containing protein n=1 Tax=Gleimia hominis TaxID=595468 RepID=UPI0011AF98A6|nr:ATP-dependent helicase C-terminal domain-containing protein [Gleimia hominis]WIK65346.1 ATP-dependent helicase C-terminal domain-containing protein [Gleimia hominis]